MTTPETRARLRGLEQQLADPTPPPLAGQTAIPLTWCQEPLWEPPRPIPRTPAPQRAQRRRTPTPRPRRKRHTFVEIINPAGTRRPYRWHGRRITTIDPIGSYL